MQHYLQMKKPMLFNAEPSLLKPVQKLINDLAQAQEKTEKNNAALVRSSQYFSKKAIQIETILKTLEGVALTDGSDPVVVKVGHTGFSDYIEVVIKGVCPLNCIDGFVRYDSRLPVLEHDLAPLNDEKIALEKYNRIATALKSEHFSAVMTYGAAGITLNPLLNPLVGESVKELNALLAAGKGGVIAATASSVVKEAGLVYSLSIDHKDVRGEINKITDPLVKQYCFKNLDGVDKLSAEINTKQVSLAKLITQQKEPTRYQQVLSPFTKGSLARKIGALTIEIDELSTLRLNQFSSMKTDSLAILLKNKVTDLKGKIDDKLRVNKIKLQKLQHKIDYLSLEISKEERKSSTMVRRFESIDELLDYQAGLQTLPLGEDLIQAIAGEYTDDERHVNDQSCPMQDESQMIV